MHAPLAVGVALLAALQGGQEGEHLTNDPSLNQRRNRRRHVKLQNRRLTVEYARFLTVVHNTGLPSGRP